jgi:ribonuclease HI
MKTIKFNQSQVELVKNRSKTVTWRFFDDKNIRVGDKVLFINREADEAFGSGLILKVSEKHMRDLDESDSDGHEIYDSPEEMYALYSRYYGQPITEDSIVKVIHFEFEELPAEKAKRAVERSQGREIKLYGDGGSRGNPGPSAGGFVILDMEDNVVKKSGKYLGITTNNQAEYHSLKGGLEAAQVMGARIVHVYMDSLLVVNQMLGLYKIKNRDLLPIHQAIKQLVSTFEKVTFTHVPRELNKLADAMVNEALDAELQ